MSSERVVSVRLLDVNDNIPKLIESQAFMCAANPKPVIIKARDEDSAPFAQPFTFAFAKKSPNWDLSRVDDTSAKLTLRKTPTEDRTFSLAINIKDNAGMGTSQRFDVKVCNCTTQGYCYMAPEDRAFRLGMGPTIGILVGTVGFSILAFIIVIKRINKKGKKQKETTEDGNALL